MNMKLRNIPFSPPDMSEAEIEQVAEAFDTQRTKGSYIKYLKYHIFESMY